MSQYIYLLQEREFIKMNEPVYKVGMTKKENHIRFNQYPKGSILLFQMICNDCLMIETQVIKIFKQYYKQRKDVGNEYFEGEYKNMIDVIYLTIKNEINNTNIKEIKKEDKPAYIKMLYENPSQFIDNQLCNDFKVTTNEFTSTQLYEVAQQYAKTHFMLSNFTVQEFTKQSQKYIDDNMPSVMIEARQDYVEDNTKDYLKDFIEKEFNKVEYNNTDKTRVKRDDFRKMYNEYLKLIPARLNTDSLPKFTKMMNKKYNIKNKQIGKNDVCYYLGLQYKEGDECDVSLN